MTVVLQILGVIWGCGSAGLLWYLWRTPGQSDWIDIGLCLLWPLALIWAIADIGLGAVAFLFEEVFDRDPPEGESW